MDTYEPSDLRAVDREITILQADRDSCEKKLYDTESQIPTVQQDLTNHTEAKDLLLKIGSLYRKVSVDRINALVTMGLRVVFGRPYEYALIPVERRGQVELDQIVRIDGMELDPQTSMGGGVVDVISFCLRVVLWSMMGQRTDAVMVLDEPFRCVSSEHVDAAAALLKQISGRMGIQFLVVTHDPALASAADKTFQVSPGKPVQEL